MIVFAAIAPHGDPAFGEGSATNESMLELGRRQRAAAPDATVVLIPHNVHVTDTMRPGPFGFHPAAAEYDRGKPRLTRAG